jgi:hypothetical protein
MGGPIRFLRKQFLNFLQFMILLPLLEQGFSIASFSGYICFDGAGCEKEKNRWEKEQLKR